jgi:hypothetical protein
MSHILRHFFLIFMQQVRLLILILMQHVSYPQALLPHLHATGQTSHPHPHATCFISSGASFSSSCNRSDFSSSSSCNMSHILRRFFLIFMQQVRLLILILMQHVSYPQALLPHLHATGLLSSHFSSSSHASCVISSCTSFSSSCNRYFLTHFCVILFHQIFTYSYEMTTPFLIKKRLDEKTLMINIQFCRCGNSGLCS